VAVEEVEGEDPTWPPSGLDLSKLEEDDDSSSRTIPLVLFSSEGGVASPGSYPGDSLHWKLHII
jgi:hypothetical protein